MALKFLDDLGDNFLDCVKDAKILESLVGDLAQPQVMMPVPRAVQRRRFYPVGQTSDLYYSCCNFL